MIVDHEIEREGKRLFLLLDVRPTWGAIAQATDETGEHVPPDALPNAHELDRLAAEIYARRIGD